MTKKTRKAKVTVNCVASKYEMPEEKIIEFTFPDGTGGLIQFDAYDNRDTVIVYQQDANIQVSI